MNHNENKKRKDTHHVAVYFENEYYNKICEVADKHHMKVGSLIREYVEENLENLDDYDKYRNKKLSCIAAKVSDVLIMAERIAKSSGDEELIKIMKTEVEDIWSLLN